uniref:Anoctamin n=1 Tax=Strix occidentalis caurina TaxID=311401 RepID=A0A8D0FM46_STROC
MSCRSRFGVSCFSGLGVDGVSGASGPSQPWGKQRGRDVPRASAHSPRPGFATSAWEGKLRQGGAGHAGQGERGSRRGTPPQHPQGPSSCPPYKLFGKRLLQAGRYIMSHKAWMKTVPTENCDVLMTFPDTTDDHTLLWLLNHIRLGIPELIVQVRHHKHTRVYAFFVTATYESLLRGADEIGLRKPVKAEFGGGMRSFSCEEDYIYENIENELYFFTSQERQNIIRYWLENLRAKQGESLHNIHFLEGQPIIPELAARGVIQQVFPLHEQRILKRLMKSWVQAVCEAQPLDEICDYFGVKIAMYFAWLGFYTSAMVYPAVFGSILYTFTESDQTSQDICCVVFAIFNVIWATLFLEEWKRRGAEFAYKWGTLDTPAESIEEPRPQFRGVKRISPVTSAEEFYYPPWKRLLFQCLVSLPVCLACLSFVFLLMLGCFQLQEFVLSIQELPRIIRFLPKIVLAVIVTTCDEVYKKIAYWLNDMENYRLQSAYEKHLIIKIVLVRGAGGTQRGRGGVPGAALRRSGAAGSPAAPRTRVSSRRAAPPWWRRAWTPRPSSSCARMRRRPKVPLVARSRR